MSADDPRRPGFAGFPPLAICSSPWNRAGDLAGIPRFDKGVGHSYLSAAAGFAPLPAVSGIATRIFMLGLSTLAQRFFGSANERKLRPMQSIVAEVNALEDE